MPNTDLARVCSGECPYGYDCKAMECEECAKIRADKSQDS